MKKQSYKLELNGLVIDFDIITYPSYGFDADDGGEQMLIKKISGKNAAEVTEQLIYQNKKEWQPL